MRIGLSLALTQPNTNTGGIPGKTYAEFVAHVTARAVNGVLNWNALTNIDAGNYTTTAADVGSSFMTGSSWNAKFSGGGAQTRGAARVVQHGLPTQAAFNDQVSSGRVLFLAISSATPAFPAALNRNGYLSLADDVNNIANRVCTEIIRWDGFKAWTSNPSIGGAETEYTWP